MNPIETRPSESAFAPDLFKGKKVLITGASRGIGRACAISFGQLGAHLGVVSKDRGRLDRLKAELSELGKKHSHNALIIDQVVDVSKPVEFKDSLRRLSEKLEGIDILINNAGIYMTEEVDGHSLSTWQQTIDTNLTSAMVASSFVLGEMKANKWGRVINISSMSGKAGEAYGSAYSASKFGLLGLTQSMALEAAAYGVTVNAVCPGWVATDMAFDQINDEQWCRLNQIDPQQSLDIARLSVPQERLIEPAEVAALVTFLATREAGGITGQAINICGGLSVH